MSEHHVDVRHRPELSLQYQAECTCGWSHGSVNWAHARWQGDVHKRKVIRG